MNHIKPIHAGEVGWAFLVCYEYILWIGRSLVLTCGRSWLFCRLRSSPAAMTPGWGRLQPGESSCSTAEPHKDRETDGECGVKRIKRTLTHSQKTVLQYNSVPHHTMWAGKCHSFVKWKGLDEMGIFVCREAVPVEGEVADLGHYPPEHTLNQTMAAAKRSATVASIFHCCANNPCMHRK